MWAPIKSIIAKMNDMAGLKTKVVKIMACIIAENVLKYNMENI